MKNVLFYVLITLMVITIVSIVLDYDNFGFTVGFIFMGVALATGFFYSMKNRDYSFKQEHKDFVDRNRKDS